MPSRALSLVLFFCSSFKDRIDCSATITFAGILLRNAQGHIQQLHDISHSIKDRVASQPSSGRQHLLMGDLDFTNMAIDNNIDHLQFRKLSGSYERSANSVLTETQTTCSWKSRSSGLRSSHYEELNKFTRSRQPPLLGASRCLSFFRTISNSILLCISIKHLITAFKSFMLFKTTIALTISFTPDTFCVAKRTPNYRCLILQKESKAIPLSCRDGAAIFPLFSESFSDLLGSACPPS